jgi:hypothetical protein
MTDLPPNPDELDEGEQANVAAAAIAGFTLAQFAFGELIKNGILPKDHAEQMLRYAIETHATAGPGNRGAAELLTVVLQGFPLFNRQLGNRRMPSKGLGSIRPGDQCSPPDRPACAWSSVHGGGHWGMRDCWGPRALDAVSFALLVTPR